MSQTPHPEVTYVLPDKLGGVFNYVNNLLTHRRADGFRYAAVRTDNAIDDDARADGTLGADRELRFEYSLPPENVRSVLRRLSRAIPAGPGVIVANGWIELALTSIYDTGRAIVAINHGDFDYYYDLAVRHRDTIDAFVTYTEHMAARLRALLPDRTDSIFLLPYGVEVPAQTRQPVGGPLRLLYAGRLKRDKGVFDLPAIDRRLRERHVAVTWTVQGTGPDEEALRAAWSGGPDVRWTGRQPMEVVLREYLTHDVLVMPSRAEGLPVSLLEAGAAGVVPVISDLPSGIPEVVDPGVTGFRPAVADTTAFADAIERLATDRTTLNAMSAAVRQRVLARFEARTCTAGYQALFARWEQLRRPRRRIRHLSYGSRLDRAWMPNALVKALRRHLVAAR